MVPYFSPTVSNLYSELLTQLSTSEAERDVGALKAGFVSKKVRNKIYWYLQTTQVGLQKQTYLGPETPEILSLIEKNKKGKVLQLEDRKRRAELCRMLTVADAFSPDPVTGRILEVFTDSGVFRLGGVLVGSHAFIIYGNLLGFKWPEATHTQDIDIAQNAKISLALDPLKIDLPDVLTQTQMGFYPTLQLHHKHPSTSFKLRGQEIHVDILTPLTGKEVDHPFYLPTLKTGAQPLRFLDYLIKDSEKAAVIYKEGLLVNVPNPARFAFHKLIISQRRAVTSHLKALKDVRQAGLLFQVLLESRSWELEEAWKDLEKRGKGWVKYVKGGLLALSKTDAVTAGHIQKLTKLKLK